MEADVTESIKIAMNGLNDIRDESKFEQKLRDALSAQGMNEVDITLGDVHRGGREVTVKHRLFGYTVEFRATHDETADNMKVYKSVDWKSLKGKIQTNDIVLLSRDGKSDPVVYRPKAGPGGQEHYSPTMKWAEGLQPLIPLADMDQRAADSSRVAHFVTEEDMAASQAKK